MTEPPSPAQAAGISRHEFDFMVCNSGADVWHQWSGERWDADEQYEGQIGYEWDRVALHRMLTKIISQPSHESNRRLPRLKVGGVPGRAGAGPAWRAAWQACGCERVSQPGPELLLMEVGRSPHGAGAQDA